MSRSREVVRATPPNCRPCPSLTRTGSSLFLFVGGFLRKEIANEGDWEEYRSVERKMVVDDDAGGAEKTWQGRRRSSQRATSRL